MREEHIMFGADCVGAGNSVGMIIRCLSDTFLSAQYLVKQCLDSY